MTSLRVIPSASHAPRTCVLCAHAAAVAVLGKMHTGTDLDLRPSDPRMIDGLRIDDCPNCRFVNEDITRSLPGAGTIIATPVYRAVLSRTDIPALANAWERLAVPTTAHPSIAARCLLRAAWVCDDQRQPANAIAYRWRVTDLLAPCLETPPQPGQLALGFIHVDALRHTARFAEAASWAETLARRPGVIADKALGAIVRAQLRLCARADSRRYTVAWATGAYRGRLPLVIALIIVVAAIAGCILYVHVTNWGIAR